MRVVIFSLIWLTSPLNARAVEFEAGIGPTVHENCHMDYCSFATIEVSVPVATVRDGVLFAVSGRTWGATYDPNVSGDEYARPPKSVDPKKPFIQLIFCSKVRPYIFAYGEGKWQGAPLRPGDDAAIFGYNFSAYQDYWAACHHFFPSSPYDPLVHKLAPKLGYHFSGGLPEGDDPITQPSDLMK